MSNPPFPYSIRESSRARYLRFRVTLDKGLEVVVPRGYDRRRIPDLLQTNRAWVDHALRRVHEARSKQTALAARTVPTQIALPSVGRVWNIELVSTKSRSLSIVEVTPDRLQLRGDVANIDLCDKALQRWLLRQAHEILTPLLAEVSHETGIPYARLALRKQKTRWGSCSSIGTISLNIKLLFVDPDLVRYILIHELCHVRHMNHSKRFWKLVSTYYAPYKEAHRRLKDAWRKMPRWVA
jgi:predicted metal-dependent hydrolase